MTAFDIAGTHFYSQDRRPDTLFYLPGAPIPELDAQSRPTLSLLRMPQYSVLQLGAQFTLTAADQSAALAQIAAHYPASASARLQPAPITVQKAAVLLADSSGKLAELKSSSSSGYPPYTAIFSITLAPDQAAQAIAAVNGRSGLLFVDYTITVPDDAAVTLAGAPKSLTRRSDVASWFRGTEGVTHLHLAG
jgi:hypothetical protein